VERDVRLTSLWREPVLHFLLIGLLLFVAYSWLTPAARSGERIVVTQPMVDGMALEYRTRWNRPPSEQELARLVDAYVRDEILYREGVAQGLDRDDPVVKRRVRQKLEVIAEEQLAREAPTDADLATYLQKNAKRFTQPGTVSFEQIYFAAATPAAQVEAARNAALRGSDPARLGQPTMLPPGASNARFDLVTRDFGLDFAAELEKLPLDTWAGPVSSTFGQHLVRVTQRTDARIPPLAEVRAAVAREWENERRTASLAENDKALRQRYEVVIDATLSTSAASR
jgi:parvulin-like peptidyl-prolyl isomerase